MRITTPTLFVFTLMLSIILMPSGFILAQEHDSEAADSENTTSDSVDFATYVMPLLSRLGCNATACHGAAIGKGGLKLSMFGAEPQQDYDTLTRAAGARRINRVEPLESLMLLKASQRIPHGGGKKIEVDSPEYQNLARWIAAGAPWGDADGPTLVSIRVAPEEQTLAKDATHQLRATAVFSDDTERDVTGAAQYRSSDEAVATVDADGTVQAKQFGESIVVVTYMRRGGVVRVLVPQPLSDEFPNVEVYNKVDELVVAKLKKLGLPPSELCSDEAFLRRVYLDVIGTLPTSDETRAFLADTDAERRAKLIDRLLDRSEFADWWALKWGDLLRVKSEFPANLWPNAVQAYHRWIKNSIAQNKPYDQFVRELITSSGSNFRSPAVNYYRSIPGRDAESFAEVTSLLFTGMRLECARCHGHPYEDWGVDDSAGMAAFFAQVTFKNTSEWKEEVVYANPKRTFRHPVTRELVA
ncbi:MAG TPA: DUF1549 domain-containing protein, partial [Thermoguttaceae bacterium]|nr:DUF1549 domain-containing protein [Thermoguttaceae bacterium]